jgi:cell division protein FtsI (penicillin-binding protein 3)
MTAPRYAVYVVLDDPKVTPKTHGYVAAGWNAAPTAARIIKRIAPILGVTPINEEERDWKEILKKETMREK